MPRKKSSSKKQPFGSKSAFVRSLPTTMPAKEVVAKAQSEGIKLSIAQVYNIRSVSRKKGGKRRANAGPAPRVGSASISSSKASQSGSAEERLRKLIAEVGLSRTREVLADVQSAFRG